ncbi:helix-turn-helix domain-containing protein [Bacillus thuringiensis]|uniref:Helix-turn-helix domain-containing protein n=1 Tax=Bacillus cereus TaxID=1396 RepID=A0A9W7UQC0_BACCE|nr:helix-turn-helix domain-containing protein [Bacillus cereus]KAA6460488.1 helix-turn-helix domain-containing protein [Bacillus cereus]KAB2500230.1 helix-turn-helix domain-containing protein [Bacillus cereus]
MRTVAKKVQMVRLREQNCKCQANIEEDCDKKCKIETDCALLNKNAVKKRTPKGKTNEEKWDERCKQAVQLFNQGAEYPAIAKKLGCNVSSLYRELKKRNVLQMPKPVAIPKSIKSTTIPPQTKKSKFERYKEYYMYK